VYDFVGLDAKKRMLRPLPEEIGETALEMAVETGDDSR
jgi:hypothetical protein